LDSLEQSKRAEDVFLRMGLSYLRDRFLLLFSADVLGIDLSLYSDPKHDAARARWAAWCKREAASLASCWRVDLFVLPSDTFPYIREFVRAFQGLRIPVIVVQKETTIAPDTMERHSRDIGEYFPFISDHMTVCSEHHRQFWLLAGADPSKISVSGQPRFDFFSNSSPGHAREVQERTDILFFSFMTDAYVPLRQSNRDVWSTLLCEIEGAVVRSAVSAGTRVVVKPHPQQPLEQIQRCRERLTALDPTGKHWRLASGGEDARRLIVNARAVVGFQTTALMESLLAGRQTIYCCWGGAFSDLAPALIPYHSLGSPMIVPRSCEELEATLGELLRTPPPHTAAPPPTLVRTMLGVCDGHASDRVLSLLRDHARTEKGPVGLGYSETGSSRALMGEMLSLAVQVLGTCALSTIARLLPLTHRNRVRLARKRCMRILAARIRKAFGVDEVKAFRRAYR
jgi:hypothetical protein